MAGCRRTIAELWSSLRRILCTPCNGGQARRMKITPQRDRHGEPPSFATLESDSRRSGNPPASHALRDLVLVQSGFDEVALRASRDLIVARPHRSLQIPIWPRA